MCLSGFSMSKRALTVIFFIVCLFGFVNIHIAVEQKNFTQEPAKIFFSTSNIITSPINITNDIQLAAQTSTGNGSRNNPYIIENLVISNCSTGINGISIQNTNKYFILQNITVSSCHAGFYFFNVSFGSILNSVATHNSYIDFDINFSSWNVLTNNLVNNSSFGFYLSTSSNNLLTNNRVSNSLAGFGLNMSSDNMLDNNMANNNPLEGFTIEN